MYVVEYRAVKTYRVLLASEFLIRTSALNEDYWSIPRSDPFTSAEIRH